MISRIGKYTIEADLGCGGFGRVYKAWDPDVRQSVAIKVMLAEGDPDLLKRFQQEVVTTASLHHQNIVTIYASGEEDGTPYLVMELLEGQTLAEIVKQRTPLSVMDKVRIMTQVAEGLAYAHSRGVVHRDVKPANIMMLPDGSVKIMDFGIAVASNRRTAGLTMEGFVLGTVSYMSPEQFGPDGKANEQTDIFAYGIVYYELMAGRHPFEAYVRDLNALRVAILTHDPPAVSELVPESPEAVDLLIHRCLAKEREFRYQTFEELRLDGASVLVDLQHDQASRILREVTPLVARGDLQQARARVREAQRLEPGNREARQLLETIDQKLQEGLNRDRIASRLTEAEKYLAERRFAEAVQSLETAARLDPGSATVQTRLEEAKAKLDGAVQANRLLEEARVMLQRGDATSALARLQSAIQIDPDHTEARRLHPKIAEQVKRRQREQIREAAIQAASEHLSGKRYDAALTALDHLERQDPEATGIAELRREIEGKRDEDERRARSQKFHLAVSTTRETLEAGDLERAGEMLEHLATNFASEPALREVTGSLRNRLRGLLRDRAIARWRQRAQDLLDRKSLREASDLIAEALREYPADTGLLEQKAAADALYRAERLEAERKAEIAAYIERVRGHLRRGDAGRALAELSAARSRHPGGDEWPVLQTAIDALQAEIAAAEAQRLEARATQLQAARAAEIAAHTEKVRGHLRRGDAARAGAELAAARSRHPGSDQWPALQAEIDALQTEAARHAEIAAYIEKVRGHLRRGDAARAGAELAAARSRHPSSDQWPALQAEIDGLQAAIVREAEIAAHTEKVRGHLRRGDAARAGAELAAARSRHPGSDQWPALQAEIDALQTEAARHAEIAVCIEKVRGHLRRGDAARAGAELAAVRSRYPDSDHWPILQAEIDALQAEIAREVEIAAYIEKVRGHLRRGDAARAGAELAAARSRHPGSDQWPILQAEIDGLQAEIVRAAEIAAYIEKVRGHLRRGDAARAGAELAAARSRHLGSDQWPILQAEIDALQTEAARHVEIAAYIEKVRGHLRRGDAARAGAELAAARSRHPGSDQWPALQAEIDALQTEDARHAEIAAYIEKVRGHLRRGDAARAGAELAAARSRHLGSDQWPILQAEIDALQTEAARHAEIAAYIEKVRGHLRRGDAARAGAELTAARSRHPGNDQWPALQAEIDALQTEAAQRAEIAAYIEKVRGHLRRGDAARAGAELTAARSRHPGNDQWPALQAEIDALQTEAAQRAEIAAYIEKVRGHLRRGDAARAGAELAAARSRHPGSDQWPALQAEIGAAGARQRDADAGRADTDLNAVRSQHPDRLDWPTSPEEIEAAAGAKHSQAPSPAPRVEVAKKRLPWTLAAGVAGAALVIPAAILVPRLLHKPEVKASTVAIEIRTDPPGAAVRVGDRSCQSPNCRLDLAPGSYPVEVKLKDYLEKRQVVVVDPSTRLVELTLEPIPVPILQPEKTETGQTAVENGTLLVQAGVADALVYVDGVARSRTGRSGSVTLSLEAKGHEVRVERNGYEATPARKVTVTAGSQQTVAFTLALRAAKLELGGAPAGAEVRSGNQSLGTTDGSAVFHFPTFVKPGSQPLQVTLGSASRTIQQRFDPGQTVRLEWKDIAPVPPPPTAEVLERQQWERIRTSSDAEQFRTFLRSYPNGAHANEALSRLADLQWSAVDQTNIEAVRKFLKDNLDNPHRTDARRIVDQSAERARLEQARLDAAKKQELARQEALTRQDQQRRQVFAAAMQLDTAFQAKRTRDVKAIWPGASPLLLEAVGKPGVKMSFSIREEDIRFSEEPDRATVQCRLLSTVNGNTTAQKATLTLRNSNGAWTVEAAKFEQER